jgi:hypothetical protein
MKAILVKNQREWNRLLQKRQLYWANGAPVIIEWIQSKNLSNGILLYMIDKSTIDCFEEGNPSNIETQTVDEYLQSESLVTINLNDYQHGVVVEPDYKALYEALVESVKDAKAEMSKKFYENIEEGFVLRADAFTDAIEILTDKTNVL